MLADQNQFLGAVHAAALATRLPRFPSKTTLDGRVVTLAFQVFATASPLDDHEFTRSEALICGLAPAPYAPKLMGLLLAPAERTFNCSRHTSPRLRNTESPGRKLKPFT